MKLFSIVCLYLVFFASCEGLSGTKSQDPCDLYEYLKGPFETDYLEGTMTFSGGMNGTIEIMGVDYNDMDCTYKITDCITGQADMVCDGAPHQSTLKMISKDTVLVGESTYIRAK